MTLIHVPRPPKSARDPQRPVNALLQAQMQHLQDAELKLPLRQQTNIYVNAIKTEGEAAQYIRRVTEAIHQAHEAAAKKRTRPARKRSGVIEIAAAADEGPRKRVSGGTAKKKAKKKSTKPARKKSKPGRKA
jgi:hypothetical protein